MTDPNLSNQIARRRRDLADLAARVGSDPSARAFVDEVKAGLVDGSIHEQLAKQTDLRQLIEEYGH